MKQTILIISLIIILFLGYKLPVDPIKNSIDFVIESLSFTKDEIETKYINDCGVQIKGTVESERCNEK